MTDKNNIPEDELIRQMMRSAKQQAPENLQYRIMHQIEAEKAVTPQKVTEKKRAANSLRDFRPIFGTAYLLLFGLTLFTIIFGGEKALLSYQFILPAALIVIVSFSLWGITQLDARIRNKK